MVIDFNAGVWFSNLHALSDDKMFRHGGTSNKSNDMQLLLLAPPCLNIFSMNCNSFMLNGPAQQTGLQWLFVAISA